MTNLKRNSHLENEFSLLTEMEMLHVFGGESGIDIHVYLGCNKNGSSDKCVFFLMHS